MSQISRVKTWVSGNILTAADLNSEFNNIINAWNNADSGGSTWASVLATAGTITTLGSTTATIGTANVTTLAGVNAGTITTLTNTTLNGQTIDGATLLKGKGTNTNNDAAAGYIGEYAVAGKSSGTQVNATNNQFVDIASVSLSAGDWDVSGNVSFNLDAGSLSTNQIQGVISAYSGNTTTDHSNGTNLAYVVSSGTGVIYSIAIPRVRFSLAGSGTAYLKGLAAFTGGPPHFLGWITARRVR